MAATGVVLTAPQHILRACAWITLHENSPADGLKVHGYNMFRRDRNVGRGGGVLFYVKDSINCVQIRLSDVDDLECIVFKVTINSNVFYFDWNIQTTILKKMFL